jgi:C-terminal processing protease CtpA/Prc
MDYRRLRMILEPNASFRQPFETDMSGLLLVSEGKALEQIKVARVFDNSPAAESGLREGDVIVSLDDSPIDLFTVEDLTELFRHLGVRRGDEVLEIELATMRLV